MARPRSSTGASNDRQAQANDRVVVSREEAWRALALALVAVALVALLQLVESAELGAPGSSGWATRSGVRWLISWPAIWGARRDCRQSGSEPGGGVCADLDGRGPPAVVACGAAGAVGGLLRVAGVAGGRGVRRAGLGRDACAAELARLVADAERDDDDVFVRQSVGGDFPGVAALRRTDHYAHGRGNGDDRNRCLFDRVHETCCAG